METSRKGTDVHDFARRLVLSEEFQGTLKRRILAGQISPEFARKLLGYARAPQEPSLDARWLGEAPTREVLEKIAGQ
jgi:hypothetical protein